MFGIARRIFVGKRSIARAKHLVFDHRIANIFDRRLKINGWRYERIGFGRGGGVGVVDDRNSNDTTQAENDDGGEAKINVCRGLFF